MVSELQLTVDATILNRLGPFHRQIIEDTGDAPIMLEPLPFKERPSTLQLVNPETVREAQGRETGVLQVLPERNTYCGSRMCGLLRIKRMALVLILYDCACNCFHSVVR